MIIATAGHVDHGKTLLVKALTGVDTDRLPDEKKRGLTIDLGFAYLPVGDATTIGFIDVPGHERFIRNALCGLAGTDFVMLIVAGDDGPMPQTREHLAIIDLLGISDGCVVLTKTDRVDAERLDEVRADIEELLASTALAGAPIFPVSALIGDGIEPLRDHLLAKAESSQERSTAYNFRLAIDRKFDVSGAGMVVTGTVFSGSISVGDNVDILGTDMTLRVRGIHAQNAKVNTGSAGQRCALNLAGTELRKDQITRGDWVVAGSMAMPVQKFDAEISILASEANSFDHWTPVHVHLGAAEATGRVALLEEKSLAPADSGLAQLVLDQPIGAVFGDRLIIRDQSAQRTLGGGRVIDLYPPRRGRSRPERIAWVRAMAAEADRSALARLLAISETGVEIDQFAKNRNLTRDELAAVMATSKARTIATAEGGVAFSKIRWDSVKDAADRQLTEMHKSSPEAAGFGENTILAGSGLKITRARAAAIASDLVREGVLVRGDFGVRLPSHEASLHGPDADMWATIGETFQRFQLRPITAREIAQETDDDIRRVEAFLQRAGRLGLVARISKNRYATTDMLKQLGGIAEKLANADAEQLVMVTDFRDASGIGRNMAIEVLEYFDKQKFTQRHGDGRQILQPADKALG